MTLQLLDKPTQETCLTLYGVSWEQFEAIDAALEDIPGVKLTYLDGTLDIMSPLSEEHEDSKRTIALLLEAFLRFKNIRFYARGGPTLGSKEQRTSGEPDDSYNLETKKSIPDLVIEVVVTSGGVNKLERYKRIGVPEVWFWRKGQLAVYQLKGQGDKREYQAIAQSFLLPDLDLSLLTKYANMSDQYDAVNEFTQIISKTIADS